MSLLRPGSFMNRSLVARGTPSQLLISGEPNAFAIDFLSNTYAINVNNGADSLIFNDQIGFSIDFTDNSYAVKN